MPFVKDGSTIISTGITYEVIALSGFPFLRLINSLKQFRNSNHFRDSCLISQNSLENFLKVSVEMFND